MPSATKSRGSKVQSFALNQCPNDSKGWKGVPMTLPSLQGFQTFQATAHHTLDPTTVLGFMSGQRQSPKHFAAAF